MRRPPPSDLVFNRERRFPGGKLNDVRLAAQAQLLRPQRQAAQHTDSGAVLLFSAIDSLMCELASNCIDIFFKCLLNMNQRTLPGAIREVLDR